jgi:2-polyprenyl-3-methyl-5-hydroxy-6-metoxy-1,4-benzoquinol methylase
MQIEQRQPFLSEVSRRRKLALLVSFLDKKKDILEIGCGSGWFSRRLKAMGYKVVGLDIQGPADIVGDILDWEGLGLKPNSFDVVIALEVIEHVDCLSAMTTVCRPNGIIFLSSPHPSWDWVANLLEHIGLNQKRTSPHSNLTDFAKLPLTAVKISRPMWIHQVGVFTNDLK